MKRLLILTILFLSSVLLSFSTNNSDTVVIKTNIYCDHCKECSSCGGKIEKDLGFEKGIKLIKLDDKEMTLTVTYNPKKTSPETIRQRISMYGFDADDVKADSTAYSKLDECCKKR
ncbi:MAG TPA: heavy metal-associated domain-containing protein [Bacteroidia bacterium]|nr:heavy metal-associated domain-containing protein [Bacteroidia bacterium]